MKNRGFTIVEMLITVAIFSILMIAVTGVFVSILNTQRYTFSLNQLVDQSGYALEYLGKQIRDANQLESADGGEIKITNKKGEEITIKLKDERIKIGDVFLTPGDITVDSFEVLDFQEEDYKRVTILMKVVKDEASLILQQTIAVRN